MVAALALQQPVQIMEAVLQPTTIISTEVVLGVQRQDPTTVVAYRQIITTSMAEAQEPQRLIPTMEAAILQHTMTSMADASALQQPVQIMEAEQQRHITMRTEAVSDQVMIGNTKRLKEHSHWFEFHANDYVISSERTGMNNSKLQNHCGTLKKLKKRPIIVDS